MSQSRKHRGYRSQAVVAQWFRERGWFFAESTGAGRSGVDVTGMPGLAVEVKARREFSPTAWLKQARADARGGLPFVVFRGDGQGEKSVHEWGVLLTLADMTTLLHEAGYGSPEQAEPQVGADLPDAVAEDRQDGDGLDGLPSLLHERSVEP